MSERKYYKEATDKTCVCPKGSKWQLLYNYIVLTLLLAGLFHWFRTDEYFRDCLLSMIGIWILGLVRLGWNSLCK